MTGTLIAPGTNVAVATSAGGVLCTKLALDMGLRPGSLAECSLMVRTLPSLAPRASAIADAFSDALGMHISEESKEPLSIKHIWEATFSTFFAKFIIAITFAVPVILLPLNTAMIVGIAWGLLLLVILNYIIARANEVSPWGMIGEHLFIAVVVVLITHYLGDLIRVMFG